MLSPKAKLVVKAEVVFQYISICCGFLKTGKCREFHSQSSKLRQVLLKIAVTALHIYIYIKWRKLSQGLYVM